MEDCATRSIIVVVVVALAFASAAVIQLGNCDNVNPTSGGQWRPLATAVAPKTGSWPGEPATQSVALECNENNNKSTTPSYQNAPDLSKGRQSPHRTQKLKTSPADLSRQFETPEVDRTRRRRRRRRRSRRKLPRQSVEGTSAESYQEEEEDLRLIEVSPEVQTHLSGQRQLDKLELFGPKVLATDRRPPDQQVSNHEGPQIGDADAGVAQQRRQQLKLQHLRQSPPQSLRRPKLVGPTRSPGAIYPPPPDPSSNTVTNTTPMGNNTNNNYINRLYLDSSMPLEVQAHVGSTAYLVCRLRSMQQPEHLQVSWVRNMQILTSGELRYTSDERFRPTHAAGSHDWALEIHQVAVEDEGEYECQVNSEPKAASVSLHLDVVTASIEIMEASPVQVDEGARIRLTCRVEFNSHNLSRRHQDPLGEEGREPEPEVEEASAAKIGRAALSSQHYIYWYKSPSNGGGGGGEQQPQSLEYNNPRGGVRVERRESPSRSLESVLTLEEASPSDSGLYLCRILPELNEVAPAECRVLVGGSQASGSTSGGLGFSFASFHPFGSSNGSAGLGVGSATIRLLLLAWLTCYLLSLLPN